MKLQKALYGHGKKGEKTKTLPSKYETASLLQTALGSTGSTITEDGWVKQIFQQPTKCPIYTSITTAKTDFFVLDH